MESESDQDLMAPKYIKAPDAANDKSKVVLAGSSSSRSKPFSQKAEIILLQAVIAYLSENSIPYENIKWAEFYGPIKLKLQETTNVEHDNSRIYEKLRTLKAKYTKGKGQNGNAHEFQLFELSKKIWNDDKKVIRNDDVPAVKKKKKRRGDEITKEDLWRDYPFLYDSFEDENEQRSKSQCHLIGRKKARDLELKFTQLNETYLSLTAKETEWDKLFRDRHVLQNFN